jgi:hypothetical protein
MYRTVEIIDRDGRRCGITYYRIRYAHTQPCRRVDIHRDRRVASGSINGDGSGGVSGSIETWNTENAWARSIGYDLKNRYARLKKYVVRIATMNLLLKKSIQDLDSALEEAHAAIIDVRSLLNYNRSQLDLLIETSRPARITCANLPIL